MLLDHSLETARHCASTTVEAPVDAGMRHLPAFMSVLAAELRQEEVNIIGRPPRARTDSLPLIIMQQYQYWATHQSKT